MLAQKLLLPLYLLVFVGPEVLGVVDLAPFLEAFLVLIVAPLAAAGVGQVLARRHRAGLVIEEGMAAAMVPLMMATLAVVIGSQVAAVGSRAVELARLIPLYAAFVLIAMSIGLARLPDCAPGRVGHSRGRVLRGDPQLLGRPTPRAGATGGTRHCAVGGAQPDHGRAGRHGRPHPPGPQARAPGRDSRGRGQQRLTHSIGPVASNPPIYYLP